MGLWRPGLPSASRWLPAASGTWRAQQVPSPVMADGVLAAVSCAGTACAAVGDYVNGGGAQVTLAAVRSGGSWHAQAAPVPPGAIWSELSGVSCASARACVAVGDYDRPGTLIPMGLTWDGTRWRAQAVPAAAGQFSGVSCSSPRACTAVGYYYATLAGDSLPLAERWDGTR
jgi:hypothetical protein